MAFVKKRTNSRAGFTLIELLVTIGIICILGGLLFTGLARAKAKACRIKCLNNLSQIGKGLISFGHNHENRMPWQLIPSERQHYFGEYYDENSSAIFGIYALKLEIQNARILHSPCDSDRTTYSEEAQSRWAEYDTKEGRFILSEAISYDLVNGGDITRPTTILGLTRNISCREIDKARWRGNDESTSISAGYPHSPLPEGIIIGSGKWREFVKMHPNAGLNARSLLRKYGEKRITPHTMNGLNRGEGQVLMADGSAHKSTDADLGPEGMLVRAQVQAHSVGIFPRRYASGLPIREHVFLKGGLAAPKSSISVMRKRDPAARRWKHEEFLIIGDEEYYSYAVRELEAIKNEIPEFYAVAIKHVTVINDGGHLKGAAGIATLPEGGVHIGRGYFKHDCPSQWTSIFIHEIQHCDEDSCQSQGAAYFSQVVYGEKMKMGRGLINFAAMRAKSEDYTRDMWDYHHSEEFAKNRIPYEEFINKNGGAFNVSK